MKKIRYFAIGILFFILCVLFFYERNKQHFIEVFFLNKAIYQVEVADTSEKAKTGLMWRKFMPQNQGMLFVFPYPTKIQMWMKNTYIPLDMIFLNAHNQVICLRENTIPLDESIISCPYPAQKVLELNAGEIANKNIQLGDTLFMK